MEICGFVCWAAWSCCIGHEAQAVTQDALAKDAALPTETLDPPLLQSFFGDERGKGRTYAELYELVQHAGNVLPRL